jgi:tetratricopeptide (TPR) repeat protein
MNYQDFVGIDPYENLSAKDKVRFGIFGFRDILNLTHREEILNVAEYYYESSMLATFEESIELLKNSEILFSRLNQKEKRVEYLIGMMKCNNSLQELIPSKKLKKKTEKLFNELITIDVKELSGIKNSAYLKSLADFFFSKTGAGYKQDKNEQYYTKAMQLYEKIMADFPDEDVTEELLSTYNNLSITLLYKGKTEESLLYAHKGLELKQDYIIYTKLALALLLSNREDEAYKVITEHKDVVVLEMSFKEYILSKMEELKDEGVTLNDYERIVKTIKEI